MTEALLPLTDWPQPTVVAEAAIRATEYDLYLRYATEDDGVAVVSFNALVFKFGYPNDEALFGHPLAKRGLSFYAVYRAEPSSWLLALEEQNRVHPSHDPLRFTQARAHFIITFQDSTFECIATHIPPSNPAIRLFPSSQEANEYWRGLGA